MSEGYLFSPAFKDELKQRYAKSEGLYERVVDETLYLMREISKEEIKIHSLTPRESKFDYNGNGKYAKKRIGWKT